LKEWDGKDGQLGKDFLTKNLRELGYAG